MTSFHFFHIHVLKIRDRRVVEERGTLPSRLPVPSVVPNSASTIVPTVDVVGNVSSFPHASNTKPVLAAIALLLNLVSIVLLMVEAVGDVLSPLPILSTAPVLAAIVLSIMEVGDDSSSSTPIVDVGDDSSSLHLVIEVRDNSSSLPLETSMSLSVDVQHQDKEK
ncbi:hypothetical protein Adt_21336 [Abeliophyllum distichum]|uniref:Uncharacterized protein n=1 Tax=Abeliophyllum distichum TaxID=126358 RepID=A0ABD1SZ68_9LAMI